VQSTRQRRRGQHQQQQQCDEPVWYRTEADEPPPPPPPQQQQPQQQPQQQQQQQRRSRKQRRGAHKQRQRAKKGKARGRRARAVPAARRAPQPAASSKGPKPFDGHGLLRCPDSAWRSGSPFGADWVAAQWAEVAARARLSAKRSLLVRAGNPGWVAAEWAAVEQRARLIASGAIGGPSKVEDRLWRLTYSGWAETVSRAAAAARAGGRGSEAIVAVSGGGMPFAMRNPLALVVWKSIRLYGVAAALSALTGPMHRV
jgi:hypothetical protein